MANVKSKKGRRKFFFGAVLLLLAAPIFLLVGVQSGGFFRVDLPPSSPLYLEAQYPVFVYGTLRSSLVRRLVFGADGDPQSAVLPGFRRRGLDLVDAPDDPDAEVPGLLLRVSPAQLAALDRYEKLGVRYQRLPVTLADGTEAWVYRRL